MTTLTGGMATPTPEGNRKNPRDETVNTHETNTETTGEEQSYSHNAIPNGNKKQRVENSDDGQNEWQEDTLMKEEEKEAGPEGHDGMIYRDILDKNVARMLDRENTSKKTMLTVKLRFKPELELKFNGSSKVKKIENPIVGHLRKFMRHCQEITGNTIVFRTFTSENEFDYKHCITTDASAEEELLASESKYQRYTHIMMVRVELITHVSQFKNDMIPWARKNNSLMIEHDYSKQEIETVRIGFIHSKHPVDTYRTDYQEQLNVKMNSSINRMEKATRMKTILDETGDVHGNIPKIRVINQFISWVYQRRKVETRGLVIECLKVDKQYVLKRIPSLFAHSQQDFVPFNMPFTRRLNAAEDYFNLISSHKAYIENLFTFPVLGLSIEHMTNVTTEVQSTREDLMFSEVIESVERTPGTTRSGKWNIIVKKSNREAAEKAFDSIIKERFSSAVELDPEFKLPYRVKLSQLPVEYIDDIIKDQRSVASTTHSTISTSQLECRVEAMVGKCENTVAQCKGMMESMEERNQKNLQAVQQEMEKERASLKEDMNQERNEFRNFMQEMMTSNNQKFTELYEFKDHQEFINENLETDLGLLKREVDHLKKRSARKEADLSRWQSQVSSQLEGMSTQDSDEDSDIGSDGNPQGTNSMRVTRSQRAYATTQKKNEKVRSRRFYLSKKRATPKKITPPTQNWSDPDDSQSMVDQE